MKRFQFRLEKVNRYRSLLKKEAARELEEELARLRKTEEELQEVLRRQDEAMLDMDHLTYAEVELLSQYRERLHQLLEEQRKLVTLTADAVALARDKYAERAKDAKSIELLKEQRREEYTAEEKRRERKGTDSLSMQRLQLVRKRGGGE